MIGWADETEEVADGWRAALWILQALPPSRRVGAVNSPLRDRKLVDCLRLVTRPHGDVNAALLRDVLPGTPFLLSLLWWASIRGVDEDSLHQFNYGQLSAGENLCRVGRTLSGAHAILVAFAGARVRYPDLDFSDAKIRKATLRRIVQP